MATAKEKQATSRIEEVLRVRRSPLVNRVVRVESVRTLPANIREKIIEELSDEMFDKGLAPDSEPNVYGVELEDLIDVCASWRDRP